MENFVLDLVEKEAIRELTARHNRAIDDGDFETYRNCFHEKAVFETVGFPPVSGRDAIVERARTAPPGAVHVTTDHLITLRGNRTEAAQVCTLIMGWRRADRKDLGLLGTARYYDELVRGPHGWRFISRRIVLDADAELIWSRLAAKSQGA
jgi:3-phenylpropionate/cinnamic acid dioxygenase small subunit